MMKLQIPCIFPMKKSVGNLSGQSKMGIDRSLEGAIEQIKSKNYVEAIANYGSEILLVGINYDKKTKEHECIIEKYIP